MIRLDFAVRTLKHALRQSFGVCGLLGAASLATACERPSTAATNAPPVAEFLIAAGDSTYWVRSGPEGIRVRSAPILLTNVEGQFYEVFISEDGLDYADASFGIARLWARHITRGDSLILFTDSTVLQQAALWKRRHPRESPIDPDDEEMSNDPHTVVAEEIEITDVHGPWLTFSHLLDVDTEAGGVHRHVGRRAVVDVRSAREATLSGLFGAAEAARVIQAGRASLARLLDSIRTTGDDRATVARETLDSFRFDSTSFAITDIARAPAVAFMVPGTGADDEALALHLPAIAVAAPKWWASVQSTLPTWKADSSDVQWSRAAYRVSAAPSADGERLSLVLSASGTANARTWPIAVVASPAYQLIPLDAPPVDSTVRAALARAFDLSTSLDGITQSVVHQRVARRSPQRRQLKPSLRSRIVH